LDVLFDRCSRVSVLTDFAREHKEDPEDLSGVELEQVWVD